MHQVFRLPKIFQQLCCVGLIFILAKCTTTDDPISDFIDEHQLAKNYFGSDSSWFLENVPFFECSDKQIEQVYYYRWKMYKAHIRNVGNNEYVITEFINHVSWDREPWCTINAASMHHIYEGRWLKNKKFINSYINYLYQQGGNNRKYSESVADAAYANFEVNSDTAFLLRQLDSMIAIYDGWSDHYDSSKNLYWIPAMPDATEYTIASIDASGGKDGFEGGEAFRPTINSYMVGNARAIAAIAGMKGEEDIKNKFTQVADELRTRINYDLWNDSLKHFCDRFKVSNEFVKYWNFTRGRELAGMIPWYFNVPFDQPKYAAAWKHVTDTSELLGPFGYRTNEPSYEYYFHQFLYYQGQKGSQWNGPSWPYQSSLALTAMANLLNNYHQTVIKNADYFHALKLFAAQHFLPDGKINLVENYDPNLGGPIVYYNWSNHYNHSTLINLVITGLCGIRPSASDSVAINPLITDSIKYFCLQNINYHGRQLTVVYDRDGDRYHLGKGLSVILDGRKQKLVKAENGRWMLKIGNSVNEDSISDSVNLALNIKQENFPRPSASVNNQKDSLYQAIDGRQWFFPEIRNWWSTWGSNRKQDWYSLDFGVEKEISVVRLYPLDDQQFYKAPASFRIEYDRIGLWNPVTNQHSFPGSPTGNILNRISFDKVKTSRIRIVFSYDDKDVALTEIECQ